MGGGELRLALPDRRFSHDALRQETRLEDLLAAWVLRARRPQVRDVLDFRLHESSSVDGSRLFDGAAELAGTPPDHSFETAIQSATAARDHPDVYFDVHCLAVSARGFAQLMHRLARHGVLRMACARMTDTAPPLFEFYAFLSPCEDAARIERSWREAVDQCHDPLPGSAAARRLAEQAREQALLAQEAGQARAALAEANARIAAMRASLSWRLTAPLRRLRAAL